MSILLDQRMPQNLMHGQRHRARTIRAFYAFLIALFVVLTFSPLSWFPSFYDTRYMGLISLAGIAMVYWLYWAFAVEETEIHADAKNAAVHRAQYLLTLFIFVSVIGDLGLYQLYRVGFQYDKVLHFAIPFVTMVVLPLLMMVRFDLTLRRATWYTFGGLLVTGVVWEVYELTVDLFFGTSLSGMYRTVIAWDTQVDVMCVAAGTIAGLPLVRWYAAQIDTPQPRV